MHAFLPSWATAALLVVAGCFEPTSEDSGRQPWDDSAADADADTDSDSDTDADADTDTENFTVVEIAEVQGGEVPAGSAVEVSGVVVGPQLAAGFHLGDQGGAQALSGVWIDWALGQQGQAVMDGTLVTVRGEVREVEGVEGAPGDGSLTTVTVTREGGVEVHGPGTPFEPAAVTLDVLLDPEAVEPWEGVLVALDGVDVTAGGDGRWVVGAGLSIGDLYFSSTALTGSRLTRLVGLVWFDGREFVLEPRSSADLVGYEPALSDCGEARCLPDVVAGEIVISEIMRDPEAVWDDHGEWFELWNTADVAVDLRGLEVRDEGGEGFTVVDTVLLPARGFALLGPDPDQAANGGVELGYSYDYTAFSLGNGADDLVLAHGGVDLDTVAWDEGVTFPGLAGASMALDPAHLDAGENDDGSSWCASSTAFGAGDLGTPAQPNEPCVD